MCLSTWLHVCINRVCGTCTGRVGVPLLGGRKRLRAIRRTPPAGYWGLCEGDVGQVWGHAHATLSPVWGVRAATAAAANRREGFGIGKAVGRVMRCVGGRGTEMRWAHGRGSCGRCTGGVMGWVSWGAGGRKLGETKAAERGPSCLPSASWRAVSCPTGVHWVPMGLVPSLMHSAAGGISANSGEPTASFNVVCL